VFLTLFKNVEFRSFMIANIVFRLCASGLTVLLGYQVYELTRSPFSLGLLAVTLCVVAVVAWRARTLLNLNLETPRARSARQRRAGGDRRRPDARHRSAAFGVISEQLLYR
jgi:hypothetical protein